MKEEQPEVQPFNDALSCSSSSSSWSDYIEGFNESVELFPEMNPEASSDDQVSMIDTTTHAARATASMNEAIASAFVEGFQAGLHNQSTSNND